jgi:hypothetical protein
MKDELRESELDASTRKTATDWLMHVISGKKLAGSNGNGNGNGSEHPEGHLEFSGNTAVAVEETPREQKPPKPEEAALGFTAEDLCGAPVVPVIKVAAAKDQITADDVCWVPAERRLKPEILADAEVLTGKLRIVPPQAPSPQAAAIHELETPTGNLRDSFYVTETPDSMITAADISREPAPYLVEPIWNGTAEHLQAPGTAAREITAADISRDWVLEHQQGPATLDMPSSFRVIRSATPPSHTVEDVPAAAEASVEPVVVEPEMAAAEAEPVAAEQEVVAAGSAEQPENQAMETLVEAAPSEEIAPETPAELAETSPELVPEPEQAELQETEPGSAVVAEAAPVEVEPGADIAVSPEPEVAATAEAASEAGVAAKENVFAREGFWGEVAARSETEAKPLVQDRQMAYPFMGDNEDIEPPESWKVAWKALLRLGSVLPQVARALPGLEPGAMGEPIPGAAQEMRQDVAGLRLVQYEIRTTVQDHSMQLKRMEEQLSRVRESMESQSSESGNLAESVRSMTKLVRLAGMALGGLLVVLIVVVLVIAHH